ncbi:MAG: CBS domain-containing protein [Actinomycetia bacterium]|nr:CBS domain-containing protein [Actinomycetes bacterium]
MRLDVEQPVNAAARIMRNHRTSEVVITENGRPVGVVSDRALSAHLPSPPLGANLGWQDLPHRVRHRRSRRRRAMGSPAGEQALHTRTPCPTGRDHGRLRRCG